MECQKKIKRVVRSTLAAEMLSLEESLEAGIYYRHMLEDVLGLETRTIKIEAFVDNKSVIEALLSIRMVEEESLKLHDINKIQWIPGHLQLANVMTKQGASGFHLLKVLQSGNMLSEIVYH